MSTSEAACCTIPPVETSYTPKGTMQTLEGMSIYTVGSAQAEQAILVIYDIFGLHVATQQVIDLLAQGTQARIVMPDLFLGHPWPLSNFPPKNPNELSAWIQKEGAWDRMLPRISQTLNHMVASGNKHIGMMGFCFGGKISALASHHLADQLKSVALVHPYLVDLHDAEMAKLPWCLIPSKDEPDMSNIENVLRSKPFGKEVVSKRFDDMHHGFCAARADFSNLLNKQRTHEALGILANFFKKTLR
ncbi:hypothetical protein HMI54_009058 [Coelomomyces lativittatus]|nr:hypothetical protein HMI56_004053 [Coelomomyces lativittatus]KAJ1502402.1 hypothetical protein HMI54_009058 [Coelomomyces lativittatus]KAJ1507335.1 hypothetical protein HMI55_000806 [Coelomomyces lativittatus]